MFAHYLNFHFFCYQINNIDHAVTTFLMPFHMEQVNAEDQLRTIVAKVCDENKTPGLLRQLDYELGSETN